MTEIPRPLRGLLAAISEVLDVPDPDLDRAAEFAHRMLLDDRIRSVQLAIRDVLDGKADLGIEWEADYLRRAAAKRPPAYCTLAGRLAAIKAEERRAPGQEERPANDGRALARKTRPASQYLRSSTGMLHLRRSGPEDDGFSYNYARCGWHIRAGP
ncbi:hypothetical protein MBT42_18435 [Streptomyces sp. MBT42]|uniref:hypothetical protein n=1 Tax=Streptomyces sp. MBT42 TaxID=1488373 RepID=UPI001E4004F7|nr:hypothetical protein [Streptomyces sp. MBT42]MCD2465535.1 hypothetical protein [Streptomyces sp. MBT42]